MCRAVLWSPWFCLTFFFPSAFLLKNCGLCLSFLPVPYSTASLRDSLLYVSYSCSQLVTWWNKKVKGNLPYSSALLIVLVGVFPRPLPLVPFIFPFFGPSQDCHSNFLFLSFYICCFIFHIFPAVGPRSELVLAWEAYGWKNVGQGLARGGR